MTPKYTPKKFLTHVITTKGNCTAVFIKFEMGRLHKNVHKKHFCNSVCIIRTKGDCCTEEEVYERAINKYAKLYGKTKLMELLL